MVLQESTDTFCLGSNPAVRSITPERALDRSLLRDGYSDFLKPWVRKAEAAGKRGDFFEGLIYLWVAFNGWLAQVVAIRRHNEWDGYLVAAACCDNELSKCFEDLMEQDPSFSSTATEFRKLWPVFKVRTLLEKGVDLWGAWGQKENRSAYRRKAFGHNLSDSDHAPRCYLRHQLSCNSIDGGDPNSCLLYTSPSPRDRS